MAHIIPFRGLRPKKELAEKVATLPYDVVSVAEARVFAAYPYNFYHVTRSEIDLPENTDVHSGEVYQKAKENLDQFISSGVLFQDQAACYYIYELVMNGRAQTGLICGSSIDDYDNGIVKKHEFTRPEKELDRINHILTTGAQTGVVFLAYHDCLPVQQIIGDWKQHHAPEYDFTASDGVRHTLWVVNEEEQITSISRHFREDVPCTYIADGHHRAASAAKVRDAVVAAGGEKNDSLNHFITCIFSASELEIMDYNRVVKDLNGHDPAAFIEALKHDFVVTKEGTTPYKPGNPHFFGMYVSGAWYSLEAKEGSYATDPIGILDVTILQQNVLDKLLDIKDPRTDKRVDFVGGIRGLAPLQQRVDSGEMAAAFSLYPVSIQQLFTIADSGNVMPPKSTWFEPKLRDGLVIYKLEQ
jgi:uncharacterized protein (DUF1015 family)